jgi:multicomponent Na+:H+ antiporter subunit A
VNAAIVFLLAHALYKGALFMIAGAVDHETGTRDVELLGGLKRAMPRTALVAAVAAVSLAGFGPVLSFIGKELLLEAVLETQQWARLVLAPAAVLAGALFVAVAAIVAIRPFYGEAKPTPRQPHEAPPSLWLGPAVWRCSGWSAACCRARQREAWWPRRRRAFWDAPSRSRWPCGMASIRRWA